MDNFMKNALFTEDDLAVLQDCRSLRLVSSKASDTQPVMPQKNYADWICKNSHTQQHREMLVPLRGDTVFTLGEVAYPCRPGTVFLIGSDEPHDLFYPKFFDNFRHMWVRIVNRTIFASGFYEKSKGKVKGCKVFKLTLNEYNHPAQTFISAWDDLSRDDGLDAGFKLLRARQALGGLLLELCKIGYNKSLGVAENQTGQHHKTVVDTIVGHIRQTGGKNLDLAKLAYIAGYSRFHFARIFKRETGMPVLSFINLSRAEKYRELAGKGLSKKQISGELGFSCPAAFSRWLRTAAPEGGGSQSSFSKARR